LRRLFNHLGARPGCTGLPPLLAHARSAPGRPCRAGG
jgi:hypothetical protein